MRLLILILYSGVVASVAHSQPQCDTKASFNCGLLGNVKYPFWAEGRNQANCTSEEYMLSNCDTDTGKFPSITIEGEPFLVKSINQESNTMNLSLSSEILPLEPCPLKDSLQNVTWNQTLQRRLWASSTIYGLYGCHYVEDLLANSYRWEFECGENDWVYWDIDMYQYPLYKSSCKFHIEVPVMESSIYLLNLSRNSHDFRVHLQMAFKDGFAVSFVLPQQSTTIKGPDKANKLIIGFSVCGATILIMCAFFFVYQRYKKTKYASSSDFTRNILSAPSSTNDPEKMGALYGVKFFTYDELEEATDSFDDRREIGDGGFGTVYLGKLKDGRTVAVKRLYENNFKRVEQFLNEVEILAHLRHKNLVMLYGCTSRHSRELLLVYEYVSNGTVADHVHGQNEKPGSLPWETRLKIAVETASALKYLHASGTIHRDVKTNNILLDDNFGVKVADFGLSRLFPLDVTHVSTAPQGTPGYVDPEYHQCYQLTDKSDVYSFGVVLVELISSKPAVDITRHRHEINLSNMAINKIQNGMLHELVDPSLGFDKDCNVHKSITAVAELAFQCLQSDKDLRPTMQEVLEILTRIQCGDSFVDNKAEELDVFSDEFVLLKSGPLPHSPESVTDKSVSR